MPATWKNCCVRISQRWICVIMTFFSLFCMYTIRVCLSTAITEMALPHESNKNDSDDTCPPFEEAVRRNSSEPYDVTGKFKWSEQTQGIILSSFYWGYIISHIPGGMIAEKFGGKHTLGLGILLNAIFTILTPLGIKYGDVTALIVLRVLVGLAQGVCYPCLNVMLSHWTPIEERSKAGSLVYVGAPLGTVFASIISGLILDCEELGWRVVFYFFGCVNILWFVLWWILCYNDPQQHPFISDKECKFLSEKLGSHKHAKAPVVPWRHVLASMPVWAIVAAMVGHGWGFLTLVSDLPKYMSSVLKFSIKSNGYLTALPHVCMLFGSTISSYMSNWLERNNYMTIGNVRKLFNSIASVGPAIFLVGTAYVGCNRYAVVMMIALAMTLMGAALPSMKVNGIDLSPNYAGSLMALTNGLGSSTGIFTPYIVGVLAPDQTAGQWKLVFWIMGVVFIATNVIFVVFGKGEVQYWNNPEFVRNERKEKKNRKAKENMELLSANQPPLVKA